MIDSPGLRFFGELVMRGSLEGRRGLAARR